LFIKGDEIKIIPFFLPFEYIIFVGTIYTYMRKIDYKSKHFRLLRNKWFIATALFLVWIVFFDENSIISHQRNKHKLYELKQQEEYFREKIVVDRQKFEDLKLGEEKLEKFAREQFYMSKPDEEVYIIESND